MVMPRKLLICAAVFHDEYALPGECREISDLYLGSNAIRYRDYFAVTHRGEIRREEYLMDFIVSLREVGGHSGEICLILYSDFFSSRFYQLAHAMHITIIRKAPVRPVSPFLVVQRFVDFHHLLKEKTNYGAVFLYDIDIWFARTISPLLQELPAKGVMLSPSGPMKYFGHPKDGEDAKWYIEKLYRINELNGSPGLSASFMGGTRVNVLQRVGKMKRMINSGRYFKGWGLDNFLVNYLWEEADAVRPEYCTETNERYFKDGSSDHASGYCFHIHQHEKNRFYYQRHDIIEREGLEQYYEDPRLMDVWQSAPPDQAEE
jgi:hypothetical protein